MSPSKKISVIIPTLNEAGTIGPTVRCVQNQDGPVEVIVVDGGSSDETRARARSTGAIVLRSSQGRAVQMNHGAKSATGDVYLFLHADTRLPSNALVRIRRALDAPSTVGGTFRLQFDDPTPLLRFYAWCTRWPWIRLCFGDRGQFVRRSTFHEVGGFPDWPLFEDLELAARLDRRGDFCVLDAAVTSSARRFYRYGPLRQQLRNLYLWSHYMLGTDPERIAHLYESSPMTPSESDPLS